MFFNIFQIMGFLHLLIKGNVNLCLKKLNFNINIFQHFNIFRLKFKNQHFSTFSPITTRVLALIYLKRLNFNIKVFFLNFNIFR